MDRTLSSEIVDGTLGDHPVESVPVVVTELYDIMRQDIPFKDITRQTLEIGRTYLGAEEGHLTRIDRKTDHWRALVSTDSPKLEFPPEHELNLETTYCRRVLHSSSQIALSDAAKQGWDDDPAYQTHELRSYIGTPLQVNGEEYGTVFFAAKEPRDSSYSTDEKVIVELISHMLEGRLERSQYEEQLTKETNLSLVLNRVLRHNLRNEMSIIRGNTQIMADEQPDSDAGRKSLRSIDRLIELSEKARELDEIVASDKQREQMNIRALVEDVIANVRGNYPSASISTVGDKGITGTVFPSFGRAIRELIENAAHHSGTQPTVEVTVESVPNAVEISIADNGPGIAEQELEVLRSGSETPLVHGTGLGLWIAYSIVSRHDGSLDGTVTESGTTLTIRVPQTPLADGNEQVSELVRARDKYKAAFDEAGDGMILANDESRILDVNKRAAEIFGTDAQELLGQPIRTVLPIHLDFEGERKEFDLTGRRRAEVDIVIADGGERTLEYTAKADVSPGQHLITIRDITERSNREQELEHDK